MFKLGESITPTEYEIVRGIKEPEDRLQYMNWRLEEATKEAIQNGRVSSDIKPVQL